MNSPFSKKTSKQDVSSSRRESINLEENATISLSPMNESLVEVTPLVAEEPNEESPN